MYVIPFRLPEPGIRKLGHIAEDLGWHAWDAIHPNNTQGGLRYLGQFDDATAAKRAGSQGGVGPLACPDLFTTNRRVGIRVYKIRA
jgi:hypothetical protein